MKSRNLRSHELQRLVRVEWEKQKHFPLQLATSLSKQFASFGLQFFKVNKTVVHVSVARPQFLDLETTPVSENIRRIVDFINSHAGCSRRKLMETLSPAVKRSGACRGRGGATGSRASPITRTDARTDSVDRRFALAHSSGPRFGIFRRPAGNRQKARAQTAQTGDKTGRRRPGRTGHVSTNWVRRRSHSDRKRFQRSDFSFGTRCRGSKTIGREACGSANERISPKRNRGKDRGVLRFQSGRSSNAIVSKGGIPCFP